MIDQDKRLGAFLQDLADISHKHEMCVVWTYDNVTVVDSQIDDWLSSLVADISWNKEEGRYDDARF